MELVPGQEVKIKCKAAFIQRAAHLLAKFEDFNGDNVKSAIWPDLRGDVPALLTIDPQKVIELKLPRRAIPIFASLRFIALRLESAPEAFEEIAQRWTELFRKFPEATSDQSINEILATSYESGVLLRTRLAGYKSTFISTDSKRGPTPDIICEDPRLIIECKDCQGTHGYTREPDKIVKWAKRRIKRAREQFAEYDPSDDYAHIICLDMPEGFAIDSCWHETGFARKFFGALFSFQNRDINPSPEDGNVFFTSFDFNQHYRFVLGETSEPSPEAWFRQVLKVGIDPVASQLRDDIRASLNPGQRDES